MTFLYISADKIGAQTGGGLVTHHESFALAEMAMLSSRPYYIAGRDVLEPIAQGMSWEDPWCWDHAAVRWLDSLPSPVKGGVCHIYAGTFTETVKRLKQRGCKIVYTAAAHDIEVSRREHLKVGDPYDYPHLTDPVQWKRYVEGYIAADVVVCPSQYSANIMRGYGCSRIEVIPHGCFLPDKLVSKPKRFTVGYLGSATAPDKGVIYLIRAWKKLNYPDATLIIAGRDSNHPWIRQTIEREGGGAICLTGFVKDVTSFYNAISCYIQPSASEGFGIEILEAMAHGRPALCSTGAGAHEIGARAMEFAPCDVDAIVYMIDSVRCGTYPSEEQCQRVAEKHTWDKIRKKYQELWRTLV